MHKCDECGHKTETLRGLKGHHSREHGGELWPDEEDLGPTESEQRDFDGQEPDTDGHNPEYETTNEQTETKEVGLGEFADE